LEQCVKKSECDIFVEEISREYRLEFYIDESECDRLIGREYGKYSLGIFILEYKSEGDMFIGEEFGESGLEKC
jgi:hypothetical protein